MKLPIYIIQYTVDWILDKERILLPCSVIPLYSMYVWSHIYRRLQKIPHSFDMTVWEYHTGVVLCRGCGILCHPCDKSALIGPYLQGG